MSTDKYFNIAHVSSVDLMSATTAAAGVAVGSPALNEAGDTIASIDANGLLSYRPDQCSVIALASGSVVKAVRPVYEDGTAQTSANYEGQGGTARSFRPLLLRSADGGTVTLVHEVVAPLDENQDPLWAETERLAGQFGNDVVITNAWIYIHWDYVAGARRWRAADPDAFVGNAAHFASTPTSQAQQLDRMAAAIVTLLAAPIPD